jgi:CRISPR/Cas system-associated exonuclease Cas4 (RecB family)
MFRIYTLLNRLSDLVSDGTLHVDINTLQRLITQQVNATSIPFHGEPAEGLQLMGVLETRNLDFSHVLLLSCNEGNLPKGVNDTSFIPYSIRKAYGLTTIDHKIAIYAYYFHRLLQRAEDITLVYNNATNDGQTGEMSRFMLQLMVESGHPITFQTLQARQQLTQHRPQAIEKTGTILQLLTRRFHKDAGGISPTAINKYMRCPLQFYYYYVAGITEPDNEDVDITDNRTFGNIFHLAAQLVYKRLMATGPRITAHAIDELLKQQVDIERAVDDAFKSELFKIKDPSRPLPPFDGMQLINREVIIRYVRQLLEADRQLAPFTILGLERPVTMPYGDTIIGGTIDRLDSITTEDGTERIRVIDYKTGNHHLKTLADVDAIFAQENLKEHSDYYLQAFLYSHIVRLKSGDTPVSPALLFIQHAGGEGYDPTLCLDKQPVTDIAAYSQQFMQQLGDIIADIFDSSKPFTPAADRQRCRLCPYAGLCGI